MRGIRCAIFLELGHHGPVYEHINWTWTWRIFGSHTEAKRVLRRRKLVYPKARIVDEVDL